MAGLDPAISLKLHQISGSSPGMTGYVVDTSGVPLQAPHWFALADRIAVMYIAA
jgi:hypothetical protein